MGDEERLGLRERKKRETRIALSWAAVRLSVERGFDNVRVEDIAAEVGVSPRTFNNYFSSKGEAIAARQLERVRAIADELRARPATEPLWEAVENAVLTRFTLGLDDSSGSDGKWLDGVRLMVAEPALQSEFIRASAAAEAEFAEAVAERTGTDVTRDLYPKLVAGAVGTAINVATEHWMREDQPAPMADTLRDALRQLSSGLPTP